jgi:hypothetical protein
MVGQGKASSQPMPGAPAPGIDSILQALQQGPQPQGNSPQATLPLLQGAGQQAAFLNALRGGDAELAQALSTPMGRQLAPQMSQQSLGSGQFAPGFSGGSF